MDFEVFSGSPSAPARPLEDFEAFLLARRRLLGVWVGRPPLFLSFLLLSTVALELTIANRLWNGLGTGPAALRQFTETWLALALIALGVSTVMLYVAGYMGKKGSLPTLFVLLLPSYAPLLLVLPATFICDVANAMPAVLVAIVLILCAKVASEWRDAAEAVYRLTRAQSGIVMSVCVSLSLVAAMIAVYASLINRVRDLFAS